MWDQLEEGEERVSVCALIRRRVERLGRELAVVSSTRCLESLPLSPASSPSTQHPRKHSSSSNSPNSRDGLDMPLQPPHNPLGLEIQHGDYSIQPAHRQKVARKGAVRIEARAERARLDGSLEVFGEVLRERVCWSSRSVADGSWGGWEGVLRSSRFIAGGWAWAPSAEKVARRTAQEGVDVGL